MSGGRFNYYNDSAKSEIFGYGDKCTNVFEDRELSELIWDVFNLIRDFDWYQSGDTCSGTWNEKKKQFKDKWLTKKGQDIRWRYYIDEAARSLERDLLGKIDVCGECINYIPEDEPPYGDCKRHKHCRWHYMEDACDDFERGDE